MGRSIDPSPGWKIAIGAIGIVYGVARLGTALLGGLDPAPAGASGYQLGQIVGLACAAGALFFGAVYARRGLGEREQPQSPGDPPAAPSVPPSSESVPGSIPPPSS